jgi:hypothetical protein
MPLLFAAVAAAILASNYYCYYSLGAIVLLAQLLMRMVYQPQT